MFLMKNSFIIGLEPVFCTLIIQDKAKQLQCTSPSWHSSISITYAVFGRSIRIFFWLIGSFKSQSSESFHSFSNQSFFGFFFGFSSGLKRVLADQKQVFPGWLSLNGFPLMFPWMLLMICALWTWALREPEVSGICSKPEKKSGFFLRMNRFFFILGLRSDKSVLFFEKLPHEQKALAQALQNSRENPGEPVPRGRMLKLSNATGTFVVSSCMWG